MYKVLLFLVSIFSLEAMRNPFEYPILETNTFVQQNFNTQVTCDALSLTSNSTWQITEQNEEIMILKNQSGEIRQVKIAQ